jgi:hypothetical protein
MASRNSSVKSTFSQSGQVTLDASEFIAFAMYRLWHPKQLSRRSTYSYSALQPLQKRPVLPAPYDTIISPVGTEDWYPYFVLQVHKLIRSSGLPTPFIFIALMYIARLRQNIPLEVGAGSEFKLLLAAMMVAQKQNSDARYANKTWSKMSGYTLGEVNQIERDFLIGIKWDLHIRDDKYHSWVLTMQTLGKEHALVLRASAMQENELKLLETQLQSRPDLVEEIASIRRAKTMMV